MDHIHGRQENEYQDDDGFDLPHWDDPRIGEDPETISLLSMDPPPEADCGD